MAYEIDIVMVEATPIAAVRVRATLAALSDIVPPTLERVYAALGGYAPDRMGHNVVFYPDGAGLMTDEGAVIECGVQTKTLFTGAGDVIAAATPAARVAHTAHRGPYAQLRGAHQAIHSFCAANGHKITGVNWEVYGDWSDDPLKLRTDVYYQLA